MARTRTAGIHTDADGNKIVDKRAFRVRIKRRLGSIVARRSRSLARQGSRASSGKPSYSEFVLRELSGKLRSGT